MYVRPSQEDSTMHIEAYKLAKLYFNYIKENYKPGDKIPKGDLKILFPRSHNVTSMAFSVLKRWGVPISVKSVLVPKFEPSVQTS